MNIVNVKKMAKFDANPRTGVVNERTQTLMKEYKDSSR